MLNKSKSVVKRKYTKKVQKPKIETNNPQEDDINFKKYIINKYSLILDNLELIN